ncbi:hypothetical protein PMAC_000377 [Pneumocystis sp. 'macacae']|nr:hypothetical protein PMAC_000377 [Pneumocystis sp. 'macacae']
MEIMYKQCIDPVYTCVYKAGKIQNCIKAAIDSGMLPGYSLTRSAVLEECTKTYGSSLILNKKATMAYPLALLIIKQQPMQLGENWINTQIVSKYLKDIDGGVMMLD